MELNEETKRRLELLLAWHREDCFCAAQYESLPCCVEALTDDDAWDWVEERHGR